MSRFNKYVHFITAEGQCFIYDISTTTAIVLDKRLFDLARQLRENIETLQNRHKEFYECLVDRNIIVSDDYDEASALIRHYEALDRNPDEFSIIVNPTLDCNLRCWYCYENHGRGTIMRPNVINAVKRLIDRKVGWEGLKRLNISFFGGEPLLGWRNVVMPLLTHADSICRRHNVSLSCGFTTNGVLLDETKLNDLIAIGQNKASFQITIDGNRHIHNNSRIGENRLPTYDIILNNVKRGAANGFPVTLRFNYTPDNIGSFIDVLSDIVSLPEGHKKNIRCSFQQIWQTTDRKLQDEAFRYAQLFKEEGFMTTCDISYSRHHCYADHENQITINYNGDLFKCTAREFDQSSREGVITPDGILEINDRYHERMNRKYSNKACLQCDILPLCNGRCSQHKLETFNDSSCRLGYDTTTRRFFILGSFYDRVFNLLLTISDLKSLQSQLHS